MRIGNVEVPLVALAPMAGITDFAFRSLCRSFGPLYTVTEMVSAKALCYGDAKTKTLLKKAADPSGVQIFGSDPWSMAQGASMALALSEADILDINMGCPTPKIVKSGDGCALMRSPDTASAIVKMVKKAVAPTPVTVKIRLGWDSGQRNALEFAKILEDAGADAVTVHGRTKTQMYSGRADWDAIRDIKKALTIPVIANGDIFSPEDALRCRRITGCEMLMVGRGSFGRPWLPRDIVLALEGNTPPPLPDIAEILAHARRHFDLLLTDKPERRACLEMRKHLCFYIKGQRDATHYRTEILKMETRKDFEQILAIFT